MKKKQINFFHELNDEFMKLYQQGRYVEAIHKAKSSIRIAEEAVSPGHPYLRIFRNNLKCAVIKYSETAQNYQDGSEMEGRVNVNTKQSYGRLPVICILLAGFLLGFAVFNHSLKTNSSSYPQAVLHVGAIFSPESGMNYHSHSYELKEKSILEAPLILQNPELPRGCEVTSLAMLLQYAGVTVDKMTLAAEIKKDPAPYKIKNGKIYFGNPYYGFVGNMYMLDEPGYGVYHGPVRKLMDKYLPGKTIDLTGYDFQDVLLFISEEIPVWVVVNTVFSELSPAEFQTWHTQQGPVKVTYKQHAVLLTGYDERFVYFNDPLNGIKNKKADRDSFQAAWVQMGKQAVTYLPY